MITDHKIFFKNSNNMAEIEDQSIDLVVTSPPYPMIEMWDNLFLEQDESIRDALSVGNGKKAFELMHSLLNPVWNEIYRILREGGFICINIGDATRTINKNFALYPNHIKILQYLFDLGFTVLPSILWRKQTNAPNKFMGAGMLPAGAYVTLEHEYILILRKGSKREFFHSEDKKKRRESAIFWEERNNWYSDIWFDIKGTNQSLGNKESRLRSAAFPFELVYRLINMYSAKGDVVFDPFLGTGTTTAVAMAAGRNSLGYEIDESFRETMKDTISNIVEYANQIITSRVESHLEFVKSRFRLKKPIKYVNTNYKFPVVTSQETDILLNDLLSLQAVNSEHFSVIYSESPQKQLFSMESLEVDIPEEVTPPRVMSRGNSRKNRKTVNKDQLTLFG